MAGAMIQQNTESCEGTRERVPNPVLDDLLRLHFGKERLSQEEEEVASCVWSRSDTGLVSPLKQDVSKAAKRTTGGSASPW